jgi:ABC-type multidrug transport system ATPase subunit
VAIRPDQPAPTAAPPGALPAADPAHEALFAVLAAVARADESVSDEEFAVLFHGLCRVVPIETASALMQRLPQQSAAEVAVRLDEAVAYYRARPYEERLRIALLVHDYAAVEGVNEAERRLLDRLCERLAVRPEDRAQLLWFVLPGEAAPAPVEPPSAVAVAHASADVPDGIPLFADTAFSLARVGERVFLRVFEHDPRREVFLDDEPAPWRAVVEILAESRVTVSPHVLLRDDLLGLLADGEAPWLPLGNPAPELPVAWLRRGSLLVVEALADGVTVAGSALRRGARRVVRPKHVVACGAAQRTVRELVSAWAAEEGGAWAGPEASFSSLLMSGIFVLPPSLAAGAGEALPGGPPAVPGAPEGAAPPALTALHVRNVAYDAGRARLVDRVSFDVEPGELVAIIGASGAGKTTLLEILGGRRSPSEGAVLAALSGAPVPVERVVQRVGFVPQDEILLPLLTVRENVEFACRLRAPHLGEEARAARVAHTLTQLGLSSRRDMRVGSPERRWLSGGQRRRVSIAVELVAEPDVLLLDEPLSGLSSNDARAMMQVLLDIAGRGRIVAVVVHQPSAELFRQFDKVVVLDHGGRLAYFGPPEDAIRYFAAHGRRARPAGRRGAGDGEPAVAAGEPGDAARSGHPDVILATLEQLRTTSAGHAARDERARVYPPEYWQTLFAMRRPQPPPVEPAPAAPEPGGAPGTSAGRPRLRARARLFATILRRHVLVRLRNRPALVLSFLVAPFLGVLLALVLRKAGTTEGEVYTPGQNPLLKIYVFMVPVIVLFFGLTGSCTEFLSERLLLRHEAPLRIPARAYFASKLLVLLAWTAVEVTLFLAASLAILQLDDGLGWVWALAYGTGCVGVALGLLVSALAGSVRVAHAVVPLILIPQLVFSGVVPFSEMNPAIYWPHTGDRDDAPLLADLMASRWCFEGLAVVLAEQNDYREGPAAVAQALEAATGRIEAALLRLPPDARLGPPDLPASQRSVSYVIGALRDLRFAARAHDSELRRREENGFLRAPVEQAQRRFERCNPPPGAAPAPAGCAPPHDVLYAPQRHVLGWTVFTPAASLLAVVFQALVLCGLGLLALRRLRRG